MINNNLKITHFQKILIAIACLTIIYYILDYFYQILLPFFLAMIFAYVVNPLVNLLRLKLKITRSSAVILLFGVATFLLVCLLAIITPNIISEVGTFQQKIPYYTKIVNNTLELFKKNYTKEYQFLVDHHVFESANEAIQNYLKDFTSNVPQLINKIINIVTTIFFVPFIAFFYLLGSNKIKETIYKFIPNRYFELYIELSFRINQQLSNFIAGQFTDAFIVGLLTTVGLVLLNVKFAIAIGILTGLANLIPYVGPFMGMIPAIIVTLFETGNITSIIYVLALFGFIQFIDNFIIQPIVVGNSVNMHPLVVMISVLIGGQVAGIFGMFLAIPVTTVIFVIVQESYKEIVFWYNYNKNLEKNS